MYEMMDLVWASTIFAVAFCIGYGTRHIREFPIKYEEPADGEGVTLRLESGEYKIVLNTHRLWALEKETGKSARQLFMELGRSDGLMMQRLMELFYVAAAHDDRVKDAESAAKLIKPNELEQLATALHVEANSFFDDINLKPQ